MNTLKTFLTLSLVLCVSSAYAEDAHSKTEITGPDGTSVTTELSHTESTGWTGNHTSESKGERVTDPKGLNNKTKEVAKEKVTLKRNGDRVASKSSVDSAGTAREIDHESKTRANAGGGTTTTEKRTEVTDPKGLGNKSKNEVTEETTADSHGVKKTTTKSVNGHTATKETQTIK